MANLLTVTKSGLYCAAGDFYVDPWKKVDQAIITHAHSDHARSGIKHYLCSQDCELVLKLRVGMKASGAREARTGHAAFSDDTADAVDEIGGHAS